MADWPEWVDAGIFDEYAPQVYRDNIASYLGTIGAQYAAMSPNDMDKLVVGLRSVGSGSNTPWPDLQAMIEDTRSNGAAGHSIWYSQGVLDIYEAELTAFYNVAANGQADSPIFGAGHRPTPLIGTFIGAGVWEFDIPEGGGYQIFGRLTGGDLESLKSQLLPAGIYRLFLPGMVEVEMLVDHRPGLLIEGDFDGDGFVGIGDLNIVLGNWNQSVSDGDVTRGDASGDGFVGIADLNIVLGVWNSEAPPPMLPIPEPATPVLLALSGLAVLSRRH